MEGKEKKVKEKKSKGKIIIYAIIILLLLVIIGGGGYFGYKILNQNKQNVAVQANIKSVPEFTFAQDEFLINLSDTDSSRYVKVKVYLGYDKKKLGEELTAKKAAIRDTCITVLRAKKAADFSAGGTETIKAEILAKVNPLLTKGQVEEVYFYDILVQ